MGTKMAPSYAKISMGILEQGMLKIVTYNPEYGFASETTYLQYTKPLMTN